MRARAPLVLPWGMTDSKYLRAQAAAICASAALLDCNVLSTSMEEVQ